MKKLFAAAAIAAFLFSCNDKADKGSFTVTGEIKAAPDQKIYLEELYFSSRKQHTFYRNGCKPGAFERFFQQPCKHCFKKAYSARR